MPADRGMIYHLVKEREFYSQLDDAHYRPPGLQRNEFVHCALKPSVVPVANDYFADLDEQLLLLEIDPENLTSETRYEAAAPLPGAPTGHLDSSPLFPHVYGPIDRGAIVRIGVLVKDSAGYVWPATWTELTGP